MIKSIMCTGLMQISDFNYIKPRDDIALISIRDHTQDLRYIRKYDLLDKEYKNILSLYFNDYRKEDLGFYRSGYITNEQAKEIIEFIEKINNSEIKYDIIVHCMAGVSRSAAVVEFIHNKYNTDLPKSFESLTFPNDLVLEKLNNAYETLNNKK